MTLQNLTTLFVFIFVAAIFLCIGDILSVLTRNRHLLSKRIATALFVLFLISGAGTTACFLITGEAHRHGMGYGKENDIALTALPRAFTCSPIEDELPKDLSSSIILYYRFGCDDCEALYDDINVIINARSDIDPSRIYWIATRSEQGQTLRETIPVQYVPSGAYITSEDEPLIHVLFTRDGEEPVLDTEVLNTLLDYLADGL